MSDSIHRRKFTSPVPNGRRTAKQQASRSKPTNRVFERSFSEPSLNRRRDGDTNYMRRPSPMRGLPKEESDPIVYLHRIRSEVFASSPSMSSSSSSSSINQEGTKREPKVVINVAVEGSPGPIRTMVKLCCNVEETIKIAVDKYCEERRTPKLDQDYSAFELHQSHFSIQSLGKREIIGEIGSRSFYMRKRAHETGVAIAGITPLKTSLVPSSNMIQTFIAQIIGKFMRRARKIWNILVCTQ